MPTKSLDCSPLLAPSPRSPPLFGVHRSSLPCSILFRAIQNLPMLASVGRPPSESLFDVGSLHCGTLISSAVILTTAHTNICDCTCVVTFNEHDVRPGLEVDLTFSDQTATICGSCGVYEPELADQLNNTHLIILKLSS